MSERGGGGRGGGGRERGRDRKRGRGERELAKKQGGLPSFLMWPPSKFLSCHAPFFIRC